MSPTAPLRSHLAAFAWLFAGVLLIYLPGVRGPFLFDDLTNILQDPAIAVEGLGLAELEPVVVSEEGRWHQRPLARLSFALHYYASGQRFDPFPFKLTNILIHALNALLVYVLSVALLGRALRARGGGEETEGRARLLAALAASWWAFHPIQLTSVLYVVQRMTSLSGLFVYLGLALFVVGRARLARGRPHGMTLMYAGVAGGVVLGLSTKENAVLLPYFAALTELFFFSRRDLPAPKARLLRVFYGLTVAAPAVLAAIVLMVRPGIVTDLYAIRDFTLYERLLTEARILFFYLGLIAFPNIRRFGLFHDDIPVSTGLLEPWTTLAAILAWGAVLLVALWGARRRTVWSFAVLWFLLGHAIESSFLALELVHEHRNYVPSLGIMVAAAYYVARLPEALEPARRVLVPVCVLAVLVLAFSTFSRASIWQDRLTLVELAVRDHPASYRARMDLAYAQLLGAHPPPAVYDSYRSAAQINPEAVLPLTEMAKIAWALADAGEGKAAPLSDRPADAWNEPLVLEPDWAARALGALDAEIAERLEAYPVVPTTTLALMNLSVCAQSHNPVCAGLAPNVLRWTDLALASDRIKAMDREALGYARRSLSEYLAAEVGSRGPVGDELSPRIGAQ